MKKILIAIFLTLPSLCFAQQKLSVPPVWLPPISPPGPPSLSIGYNSDNNVYTTIRLDSNYALEMDCVAGCGGSAGSAVNQGTPGSSPWLVVPEPFALSPSETGAVAIGTTSTNIGSPNNVAHYIEIEVQGTAPVCVTFVNAASLSAPSGAMCAAGWYMQPGQTRLYDTSTGVPSTQLRAIAAATGTSWVDEEVSNVPL